MNRTTQIVRVAAFAVLAATGTAIAHSGSDAPGPGNHDHPASHPYLGMWVTRDGFIRHELLPNGRYDEQRGTRKSAYQGRYWIKGNRIAYLDDTGFTADGEFRGAVFLHGGYEFHRAGRPAAASRSSQAGGQGRPAEAAVCRGRELRPQRTRVRHLPAAGDDRWPRGGDHAPGG